MPQDSHDSKPIHERVALGGHPPAAKRRAGISLARPGHFMAAAPGVAATEAASRQKTSRRAVRAKLNPPKGSGRKG